MFQEWLTWQTVTFFYLTLIISREKFHMKILIILVGYLSFKCPDVFNRGGQNMGNFQTNSLKYCDLDQCKPNWEPHIRNKITFSPFVNCTLYLLKKTACQMNFVYWITIHDAIADDFYQKFLAIVFSCFSLSLNFWMNNEEVFLEKCIRH